MIRSVGALARLFPDRDRRRLIWGIALPIMGGMMSQNVLNLVDIAMVGRLGDAALAATGIGSFANYLAMAFIIGLSAGVQAMLVGESLMANDDVGAAVDELLGRC